MHKTRLADLLEMPYKEKCVGESAVTQAFIGCGIGVPDILSIMWPSREYMAVSRCQSWP